MEEERGCLLLLKVALCSYVLLQRHSNGCSSSEFRCSAGQCVPQSYVCDGEGDCPDSSDEANCTPSRCQSNEFPCLNGKCIPYLYRCDGDEDCGDGSDEKCETFLDNYLIVADSGRHKDLFQIHLDTGSMIPLKVGSSSKLNAVAFDATTKTVYWTDVDSGTIRRYPLANGTGTRSVQTIFTTETFGTLEGLALDLDGDRLYYCRADSGGRGPGLIGQMSLNGTNHRIIVSEQGARPRSIVLDTVNRLMYWTDWGSSPAIVRARMDDGGDRTALVSSDVKWPNALAVDFAENVLYWGDAWFHRIERIDLSGKTGRRILLSETETNASYFAFALSSRFMYITDRRERSVRKLDLRTLKIVNQYPTGVFERLNGITYYNSNDIPSPGRKNNFSSSTRHASNSTTATMQPPVGIRRTKTAPPVTAVEKMTVTVDREATIEGASDLLDPAKLKASSADSHAVIAIAVVVIGVVVVTCAVTVGIVVAKSKRTKKLLLLEKRLALPSSTRGDQNSYNCSPILPHSEVKEREGGGAGAGERGASTFSTSCSDGSSKVPFASSGGRRGGPAGRTNSNQPILADDALAAEHSNNNNNNNIYSVIPDDYENDNAYEVIDDSLV